MTHRHGMSWPFALSILLATVAVQMLPLIAGTAEHARWDWGSLFVTLTFVVLPIACLLHLVLNVGLVLVGAGPLPERLRASSSVLVSAGYLLVLYVHPLPWFVSGP